MAKTDSKGISQQKIAQELGVSQSLVSIVLNGRKSGIAEETYNRIWKFALDNGYSPKGMVISNAVLPALPDAQTVGYFLRAPLRLATKSNFFSHVLQGLHDTLTEEKMQLVFLGSESDFDSRELAHVSWQERFLRGIVIMGEVAPAFLYAVRQFGKPIVYISARAPGLCHSVNSNEVQSGELLVEHLYQLGHRHFAYIGGMCARSRNQERYTSTLHSLQARGITLPAEAVVEFQDAERNDGYQAAATLLGRKLKPFPTAWICVNGLCARGTISHLLQNGYKVGSEISVAAFDKTRVCTEEYPLITGAASCPEALGGEAARLLLRQQNSPTQVWQDITLPAELDVRESTGKVQEKTATTRKKSIPAVA